MNRVGRMIAAAMQDRTIRLFDARNCEEIQKMEDGFLCTSIAFSPKGDILATGGVDRVVKLWDIRSGTQVGKMEGHTYPVLCLSFSPAGDRLVSSSGDTTLIVWDVNNHSRLQQLKGHSLYVQACEWDPRGDRIVSGGVDSTICVWNPNTGKMIEKFTEHRTAVHTLRFSLDGTRLASGSSDRNVILWDTSGQSLKVDRTLPGHTGEVRSVAFSTDGKYLATGSSDKEILVWSTERYAVEGRGSTASEIDGVEWFPNESAFLTCDGTGAIIRWEVADFSATLAPFQSLLKEIEADTGLVHREEFIKKFEQLRSAYDEEMLREKRLFYVVWQCKKALGLLKGTARVQT